MVLVLGFVNLLIISLKYQVTVESENMDKYFVTQITVLRGTKLQNLDSKLEALAGQISPVSFQAFICFSYISIQRASRNLTL